MAEEINFGSSALAEYVTDANEILEFKLVSSLELKGWPNHAKTNICRQCCKFWDS
mgnify:CR=1 FL=1